MKTFLVLYGKPRYLGVVSIEDSEGVTPGSEIVVRTSRGEDAALCCGELSSEALGRLGQLAAPGKNEDDGKGAPRNGNEGEPEEVFYLGPLEASHRETQAALRMEEVDALREARVMLREHKLDMKLVDVEYPLDRKKIFLYFTSEQRVDFRSYVRDLAKIFHTRIELRQIGIRDEAKVVGGIASCGLQCCCSQWLHRFAPICIRMVKEQNLALNPVKISGLCGRLMCCMGYEYATYHELWEHLPNPGAKIRGPRAVYVISGVDLATRSVRLYGEGREISVPVDSFASFKKNITEGLPWNPDEPVEQTAPTPVEGHPTFPKPSSEGAGERRPRERHASERRGRSNAAVGGEEEKTSQERRPSSKNNPPRQDLRDLSEKPSAPAATKNQSPEEGEAVVKKRRRKRRRPAQKSGTEAPKSVQEAPKPGRDTPSGPSERPESSSRSRKEVPSPTGEAGTPENPSATPKRKRHRPRRRKSGSPSGSSGETSGSMDGSMDSVRGKSSGQNV